MRCRCWACVRTAAQLNQIHPHVFIDLGTLERGSLLMMLGRARLSWTPLWSMACMLHEFAASNRQRPQHSKSSQNTKTIYLAAWEKPLLVCSDGYTSKQLLLKCESFLSFYIHANQQYQSCPMPSHGMRRPMTNGHSSSFSMPCSVMRSSMYCRTPSRRSTMDTISDESRMPSRCSEMTAPSSSFNRRYV